MLSTAKWVQRRRDDALVSPRRLSAPGQAEGRLQRLRSRKNAGRNRRSAQWDQRRGEAQELAVLLGHAASVEACAFSPDGRFLAPASHDGTLTR